MIRLGAHGHYVLKQRIGWLESIFQLWGLHRELAVVLLQSDPRGEGIALQFGPALESLSLKQQGQQNCRYTTSGQKMTGEGSVCSEDMNH